MHRNEQGRQSDCKIQRSGRNGQRDWCRAELTAIISALVICIIVCLSWPLIITVITPLPTKPSATKMPENWSWRTRQSRHADAITAMLLRSMQYTKELADAKAENDALRDDATVGRRRLSDRASAVRRVSHHGLRRIYAASPWLADTAERDYFTLRERLIMQNNWKEPRSILMSSVDRVAHIDGQLMQLVVSNTHALPAEYKCSVNKTEQSIYECLVGFPVLITFSAPQILVASTVFFAQFQKRRNDGWWFPLVLLLPVCFSSKRLLSTSCNKQGQRSSEYSSCSAIPDAFEVRRIVCRKLNKP